MTPTIQLIATVLSIIASFGGFAAWMLRHMDRRFAEARADTHRQFDGVQRQFAEARADTQRQFEGVQRQFEGVQRQFDEVQRQFAEAKAEMRQGFEQAREDRLRLERKMEDRFDVHGERIVTLHQVVGRLQGVVERTCEPERFTVRSAAPELSAGVEIREPRASHGAGSGGEEAGRDGREDESGGADSAPAGEGAGQGDEP